MGIEIVYNAKTCISICIITYSYEKSDMPYSQRYFLIIIWCYFPFSFSHTDLLPSIFKSKLTGN